MMNEGERVALNNSAVSADESAPTTGGGSFKQEDGNSAITRSALAVAIVGRLIMSKTYSQ
jgi:hypothetical protein